MAKPPEEQLPPELRWITRTFTKLDELIDHFDKLVKREIELLKAIEKALVPVEIPPLGVVSLDDETIKAIVEGLAARLVQLPNRLDRIEIDTSVTTWVSLRKAGKIKPTVALGFWVESIGGGFEYKIIREGLGPTKPRTAAADDKWDQMWDDLEVKGLGAGTAVIYLWWREPILG